MEIGKTKAIVVISWSMKKGLLEITWLYGKIIDLIVELKFTELNIQLDFLTCF